MYARCFFILVLAIGFSGCSGYYGPRGLASDDPSQKIPAMKLAADQKDRAAIAELIKTLNNEDPAMRFYAIEGLERITGQTLDYVYYEDADARRPAIERWQTWLKEQNKPASSKS